MCVAGQLPYWCCWLVEVPPPGELRLPVGIAHLQQLVLDDRLTPDSRVAEDDRAEPQRLVDRPDLVPFAALRRKITRLYRARQDDEALRWIRRFAGFDGGRNQPDLAHVQFIEALILEKSQPHRTEAIYLDLLGRQGHELRSLVHNNLAVLRCRANRQAEALVHLAAAIDRDPPLVAALLNYRLVLEHFLRVPRRALIPAIVAEFEELEKDLVQVDARLDEVRKRDDLREQLTRLGDLPLDEFAALLTREDLAAGSANPVIANECKVLAVRCFKFARQALFERRWDQARVWANEAAKHDPSDAVVALESQQLLALIQAREDQDRRNRNVALCRETLPVIEERIHKNELAEALDTATQLLAQLDEAPHLVAPETRGHVQHLISQIRRMRAQQAFGSGMAVRDTAPEEAVKYWREAAQHPDFELEATTQIALLQQPQVEQEYHQAVNDRQFEKARECARRWASLSAAPIIQETAAQWVDRADRLQTEHELDHAMRLLARGSFDEARRVVRSAALRHATAANRQAQFLAQIDDAEAEHIRAQQQREGNGRDLGPAELILQRTQELARQTMRLRAEGTMSHGVPFAPVRMVREPRPSWLRRCWSRLHRTELSEGGS